MKKLIHRLIAGFLLISCPLFADEVKKAEAPKKADTETSKKQEKKWYENVVFSGFVDVYYQYIANNTSGDKYETTRAFETYNKQFAVNAAEIDVEKIANKDSNWGFRLDTQWGQNLVHQERPYTPAGQSYNMNMLQQAYVSFYLPFLNGVTIDAGKMATHIGWELLESKDNINYTIGYIFQNTIPFIHTGARTTLSFNEDWSLALYLYNSAQGTGFNNTAVGGSTNTGTNAYSNDATRHAYADSPGKTLAGGHQLKGNIMKDRFTLLWNTVFGNDNASGRLSNQDYYVQSYILQNNPSGIPVMRRDSSMLVDYLFINNVIFNLTPTEKLTIILDWTHGIRSGQSAVAANANVNEGYDTIGDRKITASDGSTVKVGRDGRYVKRIYNTYGVWMKYKFTDKFTLGFRYENLDDSRYGGAFGIQPPLSTQPPQGRNDLNPNIAQNNQQRTLGQLRSLTLTPTYNWSENLLIKVDLRRDWALGKQFVDTQGRPAHGQNGIILGVVAKF